MNNSIKGEKHICSNCGAKFFDLNKKPIICPKCNTEVIDKSSNVRTKPLISKSQEKDNNIDNSSTEDLTEDIDTIEGENIEENIEEDEDNSTSTVVKID